MKVKTTDREEIIKNRIWMIFIALIGIAAVVLMLIFYKPTAQADKRELSLKEREIRVIKEQNTELKGLVKSHEKSLDLTRQRDSTLKDQITKEIVLNRSEINKIKVKTNEKIKSFDSYRSDDWAKYFSELPDPR